MNARLRRLGSDYKKLQEKFHEHQYVDILALSGDPPKKYLITYHIKGLKWDTTMDRPVETCFHQVEISLQKEYPREKPLCKIRTPIFHPNFSRSLICIGDHWAASSTLEDIVIHIGDMIQYKNYNVMSVLDHRSAQWVLENEDLFPIGHIDLWENATTIEMKGQKDDYEIIFLQEEEEDEVEIIFP